MKKNTMIVLSAGGACIVVALAIVLVSLLRGNSPLAPQPKSFQQGTTINGVDVSGLDAQGAAGALSGWTDQYTFTLKLGEGSYTATGKDLGMTYDETTDLQALLDQQSQDKEQLAFTVDNAYTFDVSDFVGQVESDYNAKLDQAQAEAQAQTLAAPAEGEESSDQEAPQDESADTAEGETAEGETAEGETPEQETPVDPNAPKNAYLRYDTEGTSFVIVPDQPGKEVDWKQVTQQVQTAVLALEPQLELKLDDLVEQAQVTEDSPELQAALKEANSYLDLELTYTFTPEGGETSSETIGRDVLGTLYYVDPEDMSVQVDEEILGNYVNTLVEAHSVADKTTKFKTTGGSYININVTEKGQSVDATGLYNDLLECLKSKTGGTRTAPYTAASDDNDGYWGGNYVEIDQTSQHLWLYRNGECILSCGVVSGCVVNNTRTPNGCFTIFAKNTNRYLRGSNIDGSSYSSWVYYFMPFSGGCGIHDATWRGSFGGSEYLYNGSHGCVGVSLSNAKTIYNNVSVGTHVVVYGGASPDSIPPREQNISVSASSTSLILGDQATVSVSSQTTPQFTSSNPAVLTVDGSGNVSAVGVGTADITVYCPAGNTYGDATGKVTITVSEPAHVHSWVEQTSVVHHDAVTHTEQVLVQDAWDETVTTGYRCTGCGTVFASEAECTQHIASAAASSSGATSSASSSGSASSGGTSSGSTSAGSPCAGAQCQPVTEVVHHEAVYQDQVVVDKEAWDETVLTGYVCSGCGATKGPNDP